MSPFPPVPLSSQGGPDLDLTRAIVITPAGLSGPTAKAARMLVEEVEQRSMVRWDRAEKWPAGGTPVVVVGPADGVPALLDKQGVRLLEARDRLIELCTATNDPDEAKKWRAERAKYPQGKTKTPQKK